MAQSCMFPSAQHGHLNADVDEEEGKGQADNDVAIPPLKTCCARRMTSSCGIRFVGEQIAAPHCAHVVQLKSM